MKKRLSLALTAVALLGVACATAPGTRDTPPSGLSELLERPAERALADGMRAYDDGQYPAAETALKLGGKSAEAARFILRAIDRELDRA